MIPRPFLANQQAHRNLCSEGNRNAIEQRIIMQNR